MSIDSVVGGDLSLGKQLQGITFILTAQNKQLLLGGHSGVLKLWCNYQTGVGLVFITYVFFFYFYPQKLDFSSIVKYKIIYFYVESKSKVRLGVGIW